MELIDYIIIIMTMLNLTEARKKLYNIFKRDSYLSNLKLNLLQNY